MTDNGQRRSIEGATKSADAGRVSSGSARARGAANPLRPLPYEGVHPVVESAGPYRSGPPGLVKHRNVLYQQMLKLASDPDSELYHRDSRSGVLYRRAGASYRCAFWSGYDEAFGWPHDRLAMGHPTSDAAAAVGELLKTLANISLVTQRNDSPAHVLLEQVGREARAAIAKMKGGAL